MSADNLLSRLEKVRQTGPSRWLACCPAHADKSPSLSVRELDDGRVLLHCFGGCDTASVLGAVGLTIDDLFPARSIGDHVAKGERRPFAAVDVLRAVVGEVSFLYLCAKHLATRQSLCDSDQARLLIACARVADAARAAGVAL